MKSNKISFFDKLEDTDLPREIKFSPTSFEASYKFKEMKSGLNLKRDNYDSEKFTVSDEKALWDISKDGLCLGRGIQIKHPGLLFGDSGIVGEKAILGIATVCTSTESDRLEAFKICEFNSEQNLIDVFFEFELSPGKYRGNVVVETILYLVENKAEESFFPKQSGTVMGTLDRYSMVLFDDRLLFPVHEVSEPDSPLWWAVCNWCDIEEDAFISENIAIAVNNSHPMYIHINYVEENNHFNFGYLAEIISSAMQTFIEKMKESDEGWNKIISNATFREGTIAYMISYMKQTFDWDLSSPERIAKSIRKYVDSRMSLI